MRILLVRPGFKNILSRIDIVSIEPLDLEYLLTASVHEGFECSIYDGQIENEPFEERLYSYKPDIVCITGYVTMRDSMIKYSKTAKRCSEALVIIGGAHAELNYEDFYIDTVDYIVHSGGLKPFEKIINSIRLSEKQVNIPGTCCREGDNNWIVNIREEFDPQDLPIPDRSYFYRNKRYFRYMEYEECAVVKTAYGCPFSCSFCYCCLLNGGKYKARSLDKVIDEIQAIECDNIWIVDDSFLIDRKRIKEFTTLIKFRGIRKNFIIYGRADSVKNNEDLIPFLKDAGVVEVIVGLEAIDDNKLDKYNKGTTEQYNAGCVEVLNRYGIGCTGLFILGIDAVKRDFNDIINWGRKHNLKYLTASIFTPFPGTKEFDRYKDKLTTSDCRKWDLLHLVLEPEKLSTGMYYCYFAVLYIKIFFHTIYNKRFRKSYIKYIQGIAPLYIEMMLNIIKIKKWKGR